MAFKVNDFLSHFSKHGDYAKTSKFDVRIYKPIGLDAETIDLRFQCEATELPGYNVNTVDGRYYGIPQSVASTAAYNDITLTFICAADLWEKKLFDAWMQLIAPKNSYLLEYKQQYATRIDINQYYENNFSSNNNAATLKKAYIASLWEAFPINVSPLQLNWADDGIHRLSVTFKYDYWDNNLQMSQQQAENEFKKFGENLDTKIRATNIPTGPIVSPAPLQLNLQLPDKPATGSVTRNRRSVGPR